MAPPPRITDLQPGWSKCVAYGYWQAIDPPRALSGQTVLAPEPTPAFPVAENEGAAKPSPTIEPVPGPTKNVKASAKALGPEPEKEIPTVVNPPTTTDFDQLQPTVNDPNRGRSSSDKPQPKATIQDEKPNIDTDNQSSGQPLPENAQGDNQTHLGNPQAAAPVPNSNFQDDSDPFQIAPTSNNAHATQSNEDDSHQESPKAKSSSVAGTSAFNPSNLSGNQMSDLHAALDTTNDTASDTPQGATPPQQEAPQIDSQKGPVSATSDQSQPHDQQENAQVTSPTALPHNSDIYDTSNTKQQISNSPVAESVDDSSRNSPEAIPVADISSSYTQSASQKQMMTPSSASETPHSTSTTAREAPKTEEDQEQSPTAPMHLSTSTSEYGTNTRPESTEPGTDQTSSFLASDSQHNDNPQPTPETNIGNLLPTADYINNPQQADTQSTTTNTSGKEASSNDATPSATSSQQQTGNEKSPNGDANAMPTFPNPSSSGSDAAISTPLTAVDVPVEIPASDSAQTESTTSTLYITSPVPNAVYEFSNGKLQEEPPASEDGAITHQTVAVGTSLGQSGANEASATAPVASDAASSLVGVNNLGPPSMTSDQGGASNTNPSPPPTSSPQNVFYVSADGRLQTFSLPPTTSTFSITASMSTNSVSISTTTALMPLASSGTTVGEQSTEISVPGTEGSIASSTNQTATTVGWSSTQGATSPAVVSGNSAGESLSRAIYGWGNALGVLIAVMSII